MTLFPGGSVADGAGYRYSLDDPALVDSMALAMEKEMAAVYQGVKNAPLPESTAMDMRLLFVAIARGVLRYLSENEKGNVVAQWEGEAPAEPGGHPPHTHQVHLSVDMKQP
jgi:hypothetical protein